MDNLSAHTAERSKQAMRDRGFRLIYNVPYSPDYNPIEKMWSKVKAELRRIEARKHTALVQAIGQALTKVTA